MKGRRGVNLLPATVVAGSTLHHVFARMPKHVIFDCALYLAALAAGVPDAPRGPAALRRLMEEWETLHANGIVETKPIRGAFPQ